jgi:hypothetical protein
MKKKTINQVLNKKFSEFCESIKDENVRKLVQNNSIITGGCIASMLLRERVNDFDIYFTNKETVLAVAKYYTKEWNEAHPTDSDGYVLDGANVEEIESKMGGVCLNMTPDRVKIVFNSKGVVSEPGAFEEEPEDVWPDANPKPEVEDTKPEYRPIYISCNAITLSQQIQIIIRFYGDPETIHQHYDYLHCTNYWTSKDSKLVLKQPALEALMALELVYVGSKYPVASVVRLRKFIKRGFTVNAGQILKMCFQISQLDLTNIAVLEDQLTGVDVAYFNSLVDALQTKQKEEPDFKLNYNYLAAIIDKIF